MRFSNLLMGVGFAFVVSTTLLRLALAGMLADLLVGVAFWVVASLALGSGLIAMTWWLIHRWSRHDRAVVLHFSAKARTRQVYAGKRAA